MLLLPNEFSRGRRPIWFAAFNKYCILWHSILYSAYSISASASDYPRLALTRVDFLETSLLGNIVLLSSLSIRLLYAFTAPMPK